MGTKRGEQKDTNQELTQIPSVNLPKEVLTVENINGLESQLLSFAIEGDAVGTKAVIDTINYIKEKERDALENRRAFEVGSGEYDFTHSQQKIYEQIKKDVDISRYNFADLMLLHAYVKAIDAYRNAQYVIAVKGQTMTFKTGAQQVRPEVSLLKESFKTIVTVSKMLKLDSFSKLDGKMPLPPAEDDPLDI